MADDEGVEDGLQIVVGVHAANVGGVEDVGNGCGLFGGRVAGLVVNDADNGVLGVAVDEVEAVDCTYDFDILFSDADGCGDGFLESADGEGSEFAVDVQQLLDVTDDDFAVDDLESVEGRQGGG